jgi:hypothetical protein
MSWSDSQMIAFLLDIFELIQLLSQMLDSQDPLIVIHNDVYNEYMRLLSFVDVRRINKLLRQIEIEAEFQSAFEQRFGCMTLEQFFQSVNRHGSAENTFRHLNLLFRNFIHSSDDLEMFNSFLRQISSQLSYLHSATFNQIAFHVPDPVWWQSFLREIHTVLLDFGPCLVSDDIFHIIRDDVHSVHLLAQILEYLESFASFIRFRMCDRDYNIVSQHSSSKWKNLSKQDLYELVSNRYFEMQRILR